MKPVISQNRYNDSNLKERDPLLKPYDNATRIALEKCNGRQLGIVVQKTTRKFTVHRFGKGDEFHYVGEATLQEITECHDELMAGDGKGGK